MRIVGGKFKKKKLISVQGEKTRPTSDRLRETLFNILSYDVVDTTVLDLFAGTGALGLEAMSRGASSALFLEKMPDAVSVIKKNIDSCNVRDTAGVIRWDILRNLNCLAGRGEFNLVFMDPPYNKSMLEKTLENLIKSDCLMDKAVLIAEHAASETIDPVPESFSVTDHRIYGKTAVSFLMYRKPEPDML